MKSGTVIKLVVSIGVCLLAGIIGAIPTMQAIPTWYATLNKPSFTPPNWVFGPVWTILFILIGIALFFVWESPRNRARDVGIILFAVQLAANVGWNFTFFGLESALYGVLAIIPLWILIAATIYQFNKVSRWAAYLMVPYILWVSIATILNIAIYLWNR